MCVGRDGLAGGKGRRGRAHSMQRRGGKQGLWARTRPGSSGSSSTPSASHARTGRHTAQCGRAGRSSGLRSQGADGQHTGEGRVCRLACWAVPCCAACPPIRPPVRFVPAQPTAAQLRLTLLVRSSAPRMTCTSSCGLHSHGGGDGDGGGGCGRQAQTHFGGAQSTMQGVPCRAAAAACNAGLWGCGVLAAVPKAATKGRCGRCTLHARACRST